MVAADALQEVTILTQIPFLGQICTLSSTIIPMVQNTKFQKDSQKAGFVLEGTARAGDNPFNDETERRHQKLIELMPAQSGSLSAGSSIGQISFHSSSGSFLLPATPKIFNGRESELQALVDSLLKDPARVAILGPAPIAARQTFIEIADDIYYDLELDQLLEIADNIPLAVQLVAAIAASEGCQATLEHWKHEKTALLAAGNDKHSNLEISITLSLSSPRILASPDAVELLSLTALLSDGISDIDLAQSKPPIPEIRKCKATLVHTSLAYIDHTRRLKVLAPI
ncbi:hypothetical protein B0H14DRAFT_3144100 [Mycena olivaceomarginata]|nr:hypothetical protein B0H14DRAFT_3144100 [Mycena olivaceomarginata]